MQTTSFVSMLVLIELAIRRVRPSPMNEKRCAITTAIRRGIRAHRSLDLGLGRRRRAGDGGQRGDVQLRHLLQIGEVHMVDGVAIDLALFVLKSWCCQS